MAKKKTTRRSSTTPTNFADIYLQGRFGDPTAARRNKVDVPGRLAVRPDEDVVSLGLRMPLVMQYILGCGVCPLGVIIELNGPPESHKTMLLYEFGRWFKDNDGWLDMTVTEQKISEELARSVIGWQQSRRNGFIGLLVKSMDDMQANLLRGIQYIKQLYEGKITGHEASGSVFPVVFGIDSLMGANMQERKDKIDKDGSAGRGFAIAALSLTDYLKDVAEAIQSHPMLVVLINHRKEDEPDPSNPYNRAPARRPGGKHVRFQQTYELIMSVAKKWRTQDTHPLGGMDVEHRNVRLAVGKNSAGTSLRQYEVRISWRKREIGGKLRQITIFHWDEALPKLLVDFHSGKREKIGGAVEVTGSKTGESRLNRLDRFIKIRAAGAGKYYSETLGMEKADAVSAAKLGRMLEDNPDCVGSIRAALGIPHSVQWHAGMDFGETLAELRKKSKKDVYNELDRHKAELDAAYEELREEG